MEKLKLYYITPRGEYLFWDYINAFADIDLLAKSSPYNIPYFDGIQWIHEGDAYNFVLKGQGILGVCILQNKIFIHYGGQNSQFAPPENLVVYSSAGKFERTISPPILPSGIIGRGVYQMGPVPNFDNVLPATYIDNHLSVHFWEHENSWWVYSYILDVNTYELVFEYKYRP